MEEKKMYELPASIRIQMDYLKAGRADIVARGIYRLFKDLGEYDIPHGSFKGVRYDKWISDKGTEYFTVDLKFESEKEFVRYKEKE